MTEVSTTTSFLGLLSTEVRLSFLASLSLFYTHPCKSANHFAPVSVSAHQLRFAIRASVRAEPCAIVNHVPSLHHSVSLRSIRAVQRGLSLPSGQTGLRATPTGQALPRLQNQFCAHIHLASNGRPFSLFLLAPHSAVNSTQVGCFATASV